jgi:hypothetical protein
MLFNVIAQGRTLLLKCAPKLILGALVAGVFTQRSSAQLPYWLVISFGYLNNLPIGTGFPPGANVKNAPIPFESTSINNPDRTTNNGRIDLIGLALDQRHDTGVIRFDNNGFFPMVIHLDEITVETEGNCPEGKILRPWAPANGKPFTFTLEPSNTLVLAETQNFNFDTSNCGIDQVPVVKVRISTEFTDDLNLILQDNQRVLLGHNDAVDAAETTEYKTQATETPSIRPGTGPIVRVIEKSCSGGFTGVAQIFNFGDAPAHFSASGNVTGSVAGTVGAVVTAFRGGLPIPPTDLIINPGEPISLLFDPGSTADFGVLMNFAFDISVQPNAGGTLSDMGSCPL